MTYEEGQASLSGALDAYNAESVKAKPDPNQLNKLAADIANYRVALQGLKPSTSDPALSAERRAHTATLIKQADQMDQRLANDTARAGASVTSANAAAANAATGQAKLTIDQQNADTATLREGIYARLADISQTYKTGMLDVANKKITLEELTAKVKAQTDSVKNDIARYNVQVKQDYDKSLIAKDVAGQSAENYRAAEAKLPSAAYVAGAKTALAGTNMADASKLMQSRATPQEALQQPIDTYQFVLNALQNHSPMAAASATGGAAQSQGPALAANSAVSAPAMTFDPNTNNTHPVGSTWNGTGWVDASGNPIGAAAPSASAPPFPAVGNAAASGTMTAAGFAPGG